MAVQPRVASLLSPGLPNSMAWLGWVAGPICLCVFFAIALWGSLILCKLYCTDGIEFSRWEGRWGRGTGGARGWAMSDAIHALASSTRGRDLGSLRPATNHSAAQLNYSACRFGGLAAGTTTQCCISWCVRVVLGCLAAHHKLCCQPVHEHGLQGSLLRPFATSILWLRFSANSPQPLRCRQW